MPIIGEVPRLVYRAAESIIRRTGLRKRPLGKALIAKFNVMGSSLLGVFFSVFRFPAVVNGQKMFLADKTSAGFALTVNLLANRYETGTTLLFKRIVQPGWTVVDVGAHVGYYTLLAAQIVGSEGKVFSFEPDPTNFSLLRRNIELNRLRNVVAVPKAVADRGVRLKLFQDPQGSDRHSICLSSYAHNHGESIEVEAITLDEFFDSQRSSRIDLIKLDVEGAEAMALKGMGRVLAELRVQKLIFEFNPSGLQSDGVSPESFLNQFTELGFQISAIQEDGELRRLSILEFASFIEELKTRGGMNLFCERAETVQLLCRGAGSPKQFSEPVRSISS